MILMQKFKYIKRKKATITSLLQNFKSFSAYNFAALTQQIGKSFAFIWHLQSKWMGKSIDSLLSQELLYRWTTTLPISTGGGLFNPNNAL